MLETDMYEKNNVPEIPRTIPTSSLVKFKPPNLAGLRAHNEKTWGNDE